MVRVPHPEAFVITEACIDAGLDQTITQKEFSLSRADVSGVGSVNKITLASPSWKVLSGFCQRNGTSVIRASAEESADLVVTVEDLELEDGTTRVSASMHLSGATARDSRLTKKSTGSAKVTAKFCLPLPTTLAEIGRSCSSITVGEGTTSMERHRRHRMVRLVG